ncbi:[citrate [pro-3S]-lyase] ligase [Fructobacillus pseudoficulneus]|uniref:[Citrate [pro-3S]-lyase] ligase n=1 Tax=Fructobacillus pseudoficulneus TaxID=220714 RepID=A0A3F3GT45_9LACO|nr:[citrate (pro-3S)-lyase] ligase [Fructobacillus pseudoficulneus]GAP02684.1 [citrate [pro-3S]-lyase] ligase [Fructobacillus pseudoficulneus]SEH39074.1 [citrate (pro-3S)-lyase] ligase [Fructobacillus pseudoficulneus]
MTDTIRDIYLNNPVSKKAWQQFLADRGITVFADKEVDTIDQTLGLYDDRDQLVGTGSIAGKTIKYIAVLDDGSGASGARFNQVVSALEMALAQAGHFQIFVFTKPQYQQSFEHVGFNTLAKTDYGLILEKGTPNITTYRANLPKKPESAQTVASIVMNANPFTKGHRYLVEQAAQQNDFVYVFVVNQDVSLFATAERTKLVQEGTADLDNVVVVNGGDYMVSYLSFPAYFIKDQDQAIRYQTALDASLFKEQIAKPLGIQTRYLGTEPKSHTTALYNETLMAILPPEVTVKEVPRLTQTDSEQVVTATAVRALIKEGQLDQLTHLVPKTTAKFIQDHLAELQNRITKGQNINGN